jgi:hypothetical protein
MSEVNLRWAGRNGAKDAARADVWARLIDLGVNVGPVVDNIPNFAGADMAAKRLSELEEWKRARVVKCNPDAAQIPVRLRALYDGKLLFAPVPYLTKSVSYRRIDPDRLAAKGIDFEMAATSSGFVTHGGTNRLSGHAEARFLRCRMRRRDAAGRTHRQRCRLRRSRAGHLSGAGQSRFCDTDRDMRAFLPGCRGRAGRHGES